MSGKVLNFPTLMIFIKMEEFNNDVTLCYSGKRLNTGFKIPKKRAKPEIEENEKVSSYKKNSVFNKHFTLTLWYRGRRTKDSQKTKGFF